MSTYPRIDMPGIHELPEQEPIFNQVIYTGLHRHCCPLSPLSPKSRAPMVPSDAATQPCSTECCFAKHTRALCFESISRPVEDSAPSPRFEISSNTTCVPGAEDVVDEPPAKRRKLFLYSSSDFGASLRGGAPDGDTGRETPKESQRAKALSSLAYFAGRRTPSSPSSSRGKSNLVDEGEGEAKGRSSHHVPLSSASTKLKVLRDEAGKATALMRGKPDKPFAEQSPKAEAFEKDFESSADRKRSSTRLYIGDHGKVEGLTRQADPEKSNRRKLTRAKGQVMVREKTSRATDEQKRSSKRKGKDLAAPDAEVEVESPSLVAESDKNMG